MFIRGEKLPGAAAMTYGAVPDYIVQWHRELLRALRVEFFRPGLQEMNGWRDFLAVMAPLKETNAGEFTKRDLVAAVELMREQNKQRGGNWSLRFSKIMRDPETFRDLVLEARTKRRARPRPPIEKGSRSVAGVTIATETDPAAEAEPKPAGPQIAEQLRQFRQRMKGGKP